MLNINTPLLSYWTNEASATGNIIKLMSIKHVQSYHVYDWNNLKIKKLKRTIVLPLTKIQEPKNVLSNLYKEANHLCNSIQLTITTKSQNKIIKFKFNQQFLTNILHCRQNTHTCNNYS